MLLQHIFGSENFSNDVLEEGLTTSATEQQVPEVREFIVRLLRDYRHIKNAPGSELCDDLLKSWVFQGSTLDNHIRSSLVPMVHVSKRR